MFTVRYSMSSYIKQTRFFLKGLTTNSIEHSPPCKANRSSSNWEIPCIVWNQKVHYHIYKSLPPVPILSQINPVHAFQSHSLKIRFNIILPSMPRSSNLSLYLGSPHQNTVCTCHACHMCYMPCPSNSSWFDHPNIIWWAVQIISFSLCSLLHLLPHTS